MKTKSLAVKKQTNIAVTFEPEMVEIIRRTVAPELQDAELRVFLGVCRRYGADPIMKDIVPVVFNTKKNGRTLNFIVTRDFLLKKANKSKMLDGLHSALVRDAKGAIIGAVAECWKTGSERSYKVEVDFKEYYNESNGLWGKFPGAMIRKVAESIVLKRLCGIDILTAEEMEKEGSVRISDIIIPKTKISISKSGQIKKEKITEAEVIGKVKNEKEEVL